MKIVISFAYGFIVGLVLTGANLEEYLYFLTGILFCSITYLVLRKICSSPAEEEKKYIKVADIAE